MNCQYCQKEHPDKCPAQIQTDVMDRISVLEQQIIQPLETRMGIITNHMQAVWALRDDLNEYFNALQKD